MKGMWSVQRSGAPVGRTERALPDLLDAQGVRTKLVCTGADGLFADLVALASPRLPEGDVESVLARVRAREERASTAVGGGIAIPHAMIPGLRTEVVVVATLAAPLPYDTPDGAPLSIAWLVLSPADRPGCHVQTLAQIADLCGDAARLESLLHADDGEAFVATVLSLASSQS